MANWNTRRRTEQKKMFEAIMGKNVTKLMTYSKTDPGSLQSTKQYNSWKMYT